MRKDKLAWLVALGWPQGRTNWTNMVKPMREPLAKHPKQTPRMPMKTLDSVGIGIGILSGGGKTDPLQLKGG